MTTACLAANRVQLQIFEVVIQRGQHGKNLQKLELVDSDGLSESALSVSSQIQKCFTLNNMFVSHENSASMDCKRKRQTSE
jgi:hypothetical protein